VTLHPPYCTLTRTPTGEIPRRWRYFQIAHHCMHYFHLVCVLISLLQHNTRVRTYHTPKRFPLLHPFVSSRFLQPYLVAPCDASLTLPITIFLNCASFHPCTSHMKLLANAAALHSGTLTACVCDSLHHSLLHAFSPIYLSVSDSFPPHIT
jgi:hypothetical protein